MGVALMAAVIDFFDALINISKESLFLTLILSKIKSLELIVSTIYLCFTRNVRVKL